MVSEWEERVAELTWDGMDFRTRKSNRLALQDKKRQSGPELVSRTRGDMKDGSGAHILGMSMSDFCSIWKGFMGRLEFGWEKIVRKDENLKVDDCLFRQTPLLMFLRICFLWPFLSSPGKWQADMAAHVCGESCLSGRNRAQQNHDPRATQVKTTSASLLTYAALQLPSRSTFWKG